MNQTIRTGILAALAASATALAGGPALAHTMGAGGAGFMAGIGHPLGGIDHLLAMLAVGLWAAQLGGRALWAVPASFVAAMAAGGLLALSGLGMPAVEFGIAGSVLLLGLLVAGAAKVPAWAGCAIVAVFALFHGHAHGTELPAAASPALYGLGFVLATAGLHAAGIGLGLAAGRIGERIGRWSLRAGGAAVAAAGAAIMAGA